MRIVYWPPDEYDCTPESRAIEHPLTEHFHCKSDAEVLQILADHARNAPGAWAAGRRYRCVTGPGGLVRDVMP